METKQAPKFRYQILWYKTFPIAIYLYLKVLMAFVYKTLLPKCDMVVVKWLLLFLL